MTLLGAEFNMGSSGQPSTMSMSLDEMIASRRQETRRSSRRASQQVPDKVSNVDKSIATSRAKREAALRARRGLSDTKKASQMDIDREVEKQNKKSILQKAKKAEQKKKNVANSSKLDPAEKAAIRQERRKLARAAAKVRKEGAAKEEEEAAAVVSGKVMETAPLGRPPSKKAVKAAVEAMEEKGFKIPEGYQMVISFAATGNAVMADAGGKPAAKKNPPNNNNNNNNKGKNRGGRK